MRNSCVKTYQTLEKGKIMSTPIGSLSFDSLVSTIPDNGVWRIEKTRSTAPGQRYVASWSDHAHSKRVVKVTESGETAKEALTKMVAAIKGPLVSEQEHV